MRLSTSCYAAAMAVLVALAACTERQEGLDGDWIVQQIAGAPLGGEERIYVAFDAEAHVLSGFTGCNAFRADLQVFENALAITRIVEAQGACPSPAAEVNEQRLLAVLPSVATYARRGASLELLAREPQGDALVRLRVDNFATPAQ